MTGNCMRATLSDRPEVDGIWSDVKSGILRSVSVGLTIRKATEEKDRDGRVSTRTITESELIEVSFVPVPADGAAATLSAHLPQGTTRMPQKISS